MDVHKPNLTLIVDRRLYRARKDSEPLSLVEAAIAGGITMVQLRVPPGGEGDLGVYAIALRLREMTQSRVPFIITGDLELAERVYADGVLLAERSYKPEAARMFLRGKESLVGCYVQTVTGASRAERGGADYVQVGPAFHERPLADSSHEGLTLIRKVRDAVTVPVTAFGGITSTERAQAAIAAGAGGVAVTSAVLAARDPQTAARELLSALSL